MEINKFYNGNGLSRMAQEYLDATANLDVHTEIGTAKGQLALGADATSGVPNEACVQATAPTGTQYFFSTTTAKIWKRTVAGSYSSVTANTYTAHRGARYFNGYIYYWTATKLGRFVYDTEASKSDAVGTASNSDFRASCEENLTLFITDGKYLAKVVGTAFTANALDIPPQFAGTSTIPDGNTNVIIGTRVGVNVPICRAFLWDTYSDSFTLSDEIPEIGVNTLIDADDLILAQCGTAGRLYYWTGSTFAIWENELRAETTAVGHQMTTVLNSRPLIAAGTSIYSIYRKNSIMPRALVKEYTATGTITSISASGTQLFVSAGTGVNILSSSRATATLDTPEIAGGNQVIVHYNELPTGTSIGISTQINRSGSWTTQTPITDTIRRIVYFDGGLADNIQTQARITLTPNGTNTPVISNIEIV